MLRVEAKTLQEAFEQAAQLLECSVAELKYEVVQHPKKGIFGIGKKNAVIVADVLKKEPQKEQQREIPIKSGKNGELRGEKKRVQKELNEKQSVKKDEPPLQKKEPQVAPKPQEIEPKHELNIKNELFDNFYKEKSELNEIAEDVRFYLDRLFESTCFKLNPVTVSIYDESTLFIEFSGEDAALLIGKEGYRYKALSYMLFNWINSKYGLMIRLEIAEFLKNQEEMIRIYLGGVIEQIAKEGRGQTRPLDGVLAHIALKQLREAFPNKYVSFRLTADGERYVVINEFIQKQ